MAGTEQIPSALYRAAGRAALAPSIHNTQPWRFVIDGDRLDLYTDRTRSVPVIDPDGRQRTISCGAALYGARISLAAAGAAPEVQFLPEPAAQPQLLARLTAREGQVDLDSHRLDAVTRSRRSNRRRFSEELVPAEVLDRLQRAASAEGALLRLVSDLDDRVILSSVLQHANAEQNADPAYRAELRAWTSDDPARSDGVPAIAVPHVIGRRTERDDIPLRNFDATGAGQLPPETHSSLHQTLAVLTTPGDHLRDWLTAGQALYRVLLELTAAGYVASLLSQVCELPDARQRLRQRLRLTGQPQIALRAGTAAPTAPTPRRPLSEVISIREGPAPSAAAPP